VSRLRPRLTYANVMATIAVFIALGGASYAALKLPKNSVGTKQLKKNSVVTAKVKREAITAAKVKKGTLTGSQINASTLGTIPNATTAGDASTLQGNGPNAFVRGNGLVIIGRRDLHVGDEDLIINLPGFGRIEAECAVGPQSVFFVHNTSGNTVDEGVTHKGGATLVTTIPDGGASGFAAVMGDVWTIQLVTRNTPPTVASIEVTQSFVGPKACGIFADATISL
jgi:hypothetical protein